MRCFAGLIAILSSGATVLPAEPPVKNQELLSVLIAALDDPDVEVRQNLALAIANLGDPAIPGLLEALSHSKPERRMGAAMALGQVRPTAKNAVPALVRALSDKDEGVRRQVSYALSRIVGRDSLQVPLTDVKPPVVPPPDPTPAPATARGPR